MYSLRTSYSGLSKEDSPDQELDLVGTNHIAYCEGAAKAIKELLGRTNSMIREFQHSIARPMNRMMQKHDIAKCAKLQEKRVLLQFLLQILDHSVPVLDQIKKITCPMLRAKMILAAITGITVFLDKFCSDGFVMAKAYNVAEERYYKPSAKHIIGMLIFVDYYESKNHIQDIHQFLKKYSSATAISYGDHFWARYNVSSVKSI